MAGEKHIVKAGEGTGVRFLFPVQNSPEPHRPGGRPSGPGKGPVHPPALPWLH